jgi:hypothetical protein
MEASKAMQERAGDWNNVVSFYFVV